MSSLNNNNNDDHNQTSDVLTDLTRVRDHWKQIGLNSKKEILDKQGLDIATQREKSSNARKTLSQETKAFKKLKDAEKLTRFAKLLKSYQDEVDALTKRSLSSETSFLELYNELREAPDPSLSLDAAALLVATANSSHHENASIESSSSSSMKMSDDEVERLKNQLRHYEEEFIHLKDQDVKIHSLEKKVSEYENSMAKRIERELEVKQSEWQREREEFLSHYREKEQIMTHQVHLARQELTSVQQLYENAQNELFNVKSRNEETESNQQSQFETMNEEIASLSQSVVSLQSENDMLREQLSQIRGRSNASSTSNNDNSGGQDKGSDESNQQDNEAEDELVRAQREAQMKQLLLTIQNLQSSLDQKKERSEKLQKQVSESNMKILELEQLLLKRPTDEAYNQMKERARMLEELAFSSTTTDPDSISQKSVEQLLSEKNRYLEDQITKTKRLASESEQQLKISNEELNELRRKTAEQQELIQKLENDLASEQVVPPSPIATDSNAATMFNQDGQTSNSSTASTSASAAAAPSGKEQGSTMLQIVTEQRNRFKKRLHEVEEENQLLNEKLARVQNDLNILQKDNVSLYEKIRYLQSYNANDSSSSSSSSSSVVSSSPVNEEKADRSSRGSVQRNVNKSYNPNLDLEDPIGDKYKKLYEQKLDPFKQFHKNEKTSEYKKLTAPEKITFSMTRLMLSHKYSRLFVFFYLIALHLLVFAVSYRLSHQPLCGSNHD